MITETSQNSTNQKSPSQNIDNPIEQIFEIPKEDNDIKNQGQDVAEVFKVEQSRDPQEKPQQVTMAPDIDHYLERISPPETNSESSSENHPSNNSRVSIVSSQNSSSSSIYETKIYKQNQGKYYELYQQKAQEIHLFPLANEQKETYRIKLTNHQVMSKPFDDFGNKVFVKDVITHGDRVFEIRLQMGTEIVQISVFNNIEQSYIHKTAPGRRSSTKQRNYLLDDESIEKFYPLYHDLPNKQDRKKIKSVFLRGLKEVALSKIMSALETGPKFKKPLGFDMIRFRNGFCFNMEKCIDHQAKQHLHGKGLSQLYKIFNAKDRFDLTRCLSTMHAFKVAHNDIKQENIMYSPHFKKFVFIDFDISSIVKQEIGEATLIDGYFGTPLSLSPEMNEIFESCQKSGKKYFLAKCNLFLGDLQTFSSFLKKCQDAEASFKKAVQQIIKVESYDLMKDLETKFSNLNKEFQKKIREKNPQSYTLNLDKITQKFSGYEEKQLLWIRFYSHFYHGDMKQIKKDIMFFVDWQQWRNEALVPKEHIKAVLEQQMEKTFQEIKKTFYYSDFKGQVIQFFRWMNDLKQKQNIFSTLDVGDIIRSLDFRIPQLTDWMIFGIKKKMQSQPLLEDYQSDEISLTENIVSKNKQKIYPNFYKVQDQLLMLDRLNRNQSAIDLTQLSRCQIYEIERLKKLSMKEIIEKFIYYMSFRKRLGTTTLEKRKIVAQFLLDKLGLLNGFYFKAQEYKCSLSEYFPHIRSYFKDLMIEYEDFQPILNSYLAIVFWIFLYQDFEQTSEQKIVQNQFKILAMQQILYNLVLAGYFNEKMIINVTLQVYEWFTQIKLIRKEEQNLFATLNLVLKFRQLQQISKVNFLVYYDLKKYQDQLRYRQKTQDYIENSCNYQSFNRLQYKILTEALKTYIQAKNPLKQSKKQAQVKSTLQYKAVQYYLQFLDCQHERTQARYTVIFQKVKEMMVSNPHEIIDLYKIVGVVQMGYAVGSQGQTIEEMFKECQRYKNYHREEPIPEKLLIDRFSYAEKKTILAQYKRAYFQPQMLVILNFLDIVKRVNSAYESQFYTRVNQIIWMQELFYQNCLVGRMFQSYFKKNENTGERQFINSNHMIQTFARQRNFMRQRHDFFSYKDINKLTILMTLMRTDRHQSIKNQSHFKHHQALQTIETEFYELLEDFISFAVMSMDVTSRNICENVYVILIIVDLLIMEKHQSEQEIKILVSESQKQLLSSETVRRDKLRQILSSTNRGIGLKITEYCQFLIHHQPQDNESCELIKNTLIMIELKLRLSIKPLEQLVLRSFLRDKVYIERDAQKMYQNLRYNSFKNKLEKIFYSYVLDTMMALRFTLKSLYLKQIQSQKISITSQGNKQNQNPPGHQEQASKQLLDKSIAKQSTYSDYRSFKRQYLKKRSDPLNQVILDLYQKYLKPCSGFQISEKNLNLCAQICLLLVQDLHSNNDNEDQRVFTLLSKKGNNQQAGNRKPTDSQQMLDQKDKVYRQIYKILIQSYDSNASLCGSRCEYRISQVCDAVFSQLSFYQILEFQYIFYERWFQVKFETRPSYQNVTERRKKRLSMSIHEAFALQNRHLPLVVSICNLRMLRIYQQSLPFLDKTPSPGELYILDLYQRNRMNTNMTFLRNMCLKKQQNPDPILQKSMLFSRNLEDYGKRSDIIQLTQKVNKTSEQSQAWCAQKLKQQIEDNKLVFDTEVNRLVQTSIKGLKEETQSEIRQFLRDEKGDAIQKKPFSPQTIIKLIERAINKNRDLTRIRTFYKSAFSSMQSYFQTLCSTQQVIEGKRVLSYGKKISQLFQNPAFTLEKDSKILQIVEFMNLFRVFAMDYNEYMKFINLSDKVNRIELMVGMNRCSWKDLKGARNFVMGLRHNKRKSNLYDMKNLGKLIEISPYALDGPEEAQFLQGKSRIEEWAHKGLVKKANKYKAGYAGYLLRNLGVFH